MMNNATWRSSAIERVTLTAVFTLALLAVSVTRSNAQIGPCDGYVVTTQGVSAIGIFQFNIVVHYDSTTSSGIIHQGETRSITPDGTANFSYYPAGGKTMLSIDMFGQSIPADGQPHKITLSNGYCLQVTILPAYPGFPCPVNVEIMTVSCTS
ncbi:MAG: hypothetical protein JST22_00615 [Bacteroidetes bacterium]|nr:hypothetical protein [Bacteroidota bacterium]